MGHTCVTVLRGRSGRSYTSRYGPITGYARTATLSAFTHSVPDDYATTYFWPIRVDAPLFPEQGPDLISGAVTMNDATFTTFLSLARGTSAKSRFNCRALLDTGSSQSVIRYGCTPSSMRQYNAMFSPAWQKQLDALLIALHSFLRGTWSALTDIPPSRASTWSIRSPLTTARTPRVASFLRVDKQPP